MSQEYVGLDCVLQEREAWDLAVVQDPFLSTDKVERSGYVDITSGVLVPSRPYFLVLTDTALHVFRSSSTLRLFEGSIAARVVAQRLEELPMEAVEAVSTVGSDPKSFVVQTSYHFRAASERSRDEWLQALKGVCERV
eukprot:m51a1_g10719 hypothetical protein (138) ;mRNA; r:225259-225775